MKRILTAFEWGRVQSLQPVQRDADLPRLLRLRFLFALEALLSDIVDELHDELRVERDHDRPEEVAVDLQELLPLRRHVLEEARDEPRQRHHLRDRELRPHRHRDAPDLVVHEDPEFVSEDAMQEAELHELQLRQEELL